MGPTGFVLILPQRRGSLNAPLMRVPDASPDEFVYLFDILTSAPLPGANAAFTQKMLARNRRLYDRAVAQGGTRYPIGAIEFSQADWVQHFGPRWPAFLAAKQTYDPDGILNAGAGIFAPPPPSDSTGAPTLLDTVKRQLVGHGGLLGPGGLLRGGG